MRVLGLLDGGEQHGARACLAEPTQFGQRRLMGGVKQFRAIACGEFGVAIAAVGVVLAAQFGRWGQVFQPDHLRHQFLVDAARIEAVEEDAGTVRLGGIVVDALDAEHGFSFQKVTLFRTVCCNHSADRRQRLIRRHRIRPGCGR